MCSHYQEWAHPTFPSVLGVLPTLVIRVAALVQAIMSAWRHIMPVGGRKVCLRHKRTYLAGAWDTVSRAWVHGHRLSLNPQQPGWLELRAVPLGGCWDPGSLVQWPLACCPLLFLLGVRLPLWTLPGPPCVASPIWILLFSSTRSGRASSAPGALAGHRGKAQTPPAITAVGLPMIPALWRLRQEDPKLTPSLGSVTIDRDPVSK